MALRKIFTDREPALHKVCKPVTSFDKKLHKLLDDMTDTLVDSQGVGLAAPQVGILRRVVLVDTGETILELVNPSLLETSGEQEGPEGCLSVPGKYGFVKRPNYAKVRAQDRYGEWFEVEGTAETILSQNIRKNLKNSTIWYTRCSAKMSLPQSTVKSKRQNVIVGKLMICWQKSVSLTVSIR